MRLAQITLVSGFLGVGKTTLLRQLILQSLAAGERCVVIENEFGSVGLDAALLAQTGVPVLELNQGCLCCTLKTDFATTLEAVLRAEPQPDRVFFEPSGVFIPDSVLEVLGGNPFRELCELTSFVTVVDATRLAKGNPMFHDFLKRQTRFAHHLVLSKTDGMDETALEALLATARTLNPDASCTVAPRAGVSREVLEVLLGPAPAAIEHQTPARRYRQPSVPGHGLESLSLQPGPFASEAAARRAFAQLDGPEFGEVLRAKGWVEVAGRGVALSWVGSELELHAAGNSSPPRAPELVFIGQQLNRDALVHWNKETLA